MVSGQDVWELVKLEFVTVVGWLNLVVLLSSLALALDPSVLQRSGPKGSRKWRVEFYRTEMSTSERYKRCGLVLVSFVVCVIVIGVVRYIDSSFAGVSVGNSQTEESRMPVGPE